MSVGATSADHWYGKLTATTDAVPVENAGSAARLALPGTTPSTAVSTDERAYPCDEADGAGTNESMPHEALESAADGSESDSGSSNATDGSLLEHQVRP